MCGRYAGKEGYANDTQGWRISDQTLIKVRVDSLLYARDRAFTPIHVRACRHRLRTGRWVSPQPALHDATTT